jgi:hypothetical protein
VLEDELFADEIILTVDQAEDGERHERKNEYERRKPAPWIILTVVLKLKTITRVYRR